MLSRLPEKSTVPPDGWQYLQVETQATITGGDWYNLLDNIKSHRRANNIPIGNDFENAVEYDICQQLKARGHNWCERRVDGLGDVAYAVFHPIAKTIDRALGTNVKECGSCGKRRVQWNG